jgi:hypothetical protein
METRNYCVSNTLHLINQTIAKDEPKTVAIETPTNHIAVIDCSGSMSWDLPKIREQLKAKLPKLLKEPDTISIVWFSGRREFGVLLEAEPVATLKDLQDVNKAIDRWLKPVGLTGFKEPLEEIPELVDRIAKKRKDSTFSLFFMSDGCDNQWPRPDILKAVEKAGQKVSSATFVEYGYYADRPLLTQMAEKCGGTLIFAQDFDQFAPSFEAVMQKKVTGAPRIEVPISGDPISGFVYGLVDGDLVTFSVEGGKVQVPKDLKEIWYLSPNAVGTYAGDVTAGAHDTVTPGNGCSGQAALPAAYAGLSLYAQRMKSDVVFALLKATGDVRFIEQFANCFGKQAYSAFTDAAKQAAFDAKLFFTQGYDPNKVPADDAFTVLDLLRVLAGDDDNRILLDSKDFKYSKIGRGRIDSSDVLTAEEQAEIQKLTEEMGRTKDAKKVADLTAKIAAVTANKGPALKFEADKNDDGYPISSLTYNEERPNVSFLVRKTGKVDLSARIKDNAALAKVPPVIDTFIFRNYTVIKDGLVNLDRLPVRLTAGTIRALKEQGMPIEAVVAIEGETDVQTRVRAAKASDGRPVPVVFDLKQLPIINRKMVKEVSAKALFEKEYELTKARAAQKVYNTYKKEHFPRKSEGFTETYGKEAADWLKEQGLTDYSGFNPKSVQAEAKDFYLGKELTVSLKGFSSLPSVKEAREKAAKGKLTPSAALMAPYIQEVEDFLASDVYRNSTKKEALFEGWLDGQQKTATKKVRELLFEMAQIKFGIIVGQCWFTEFKSLDENTLTIDAGGQKLECKVDLREVEIKI